MPKKRSVSLTILESQQLHSLNVGNHGATQNVFNR